MNSNCFEIWIILNQPCCMVGSAVKSCYNKFCLQAILKHRLLYYYVNTPVEWGSTYCFTAVGVRVRVSVTPNTKGPPAKIFFGWHVFCSLGHYLLFSDMTLTLGLRSRFEIFFYWNVFCHYLVKSIREILTKHSRKLHRHLEHDLILVDLYLTYIMSCVVCLGLKLLFGGLDNQTPELQVEIGFYLPEW